MAKFRERHEEGFTLIELLLVVSIVGILAAIAIPNYVGQQKRAEDSAATAQLRTAATSQRLYHSEQDAFANTTTALEAYGFRQGDQRITVANADANAYCMQAPGGTDTFKMTQNIGPVPGNC